MYNVEATKTTTNAPVAPIIMPDATPDGTDGQKGQAAKKQLAQAAAQTTQINPFEMPALSPEFSKEIMAKLQLLKGAQMMNPIESTGSVAPKMDVSAMLGANPDGAGNELLVQSKLHPQVKNINSLVPGQTFSAEILDMKQGSVSLRMAEGGTLTARSLVTPDARIGDMASFVVRETKPGQVFLEFLRGSGGVSASIVREALSAANMQLTTANAGIVEDLVTRNMPIDIGTIQRTAFFKYSMPDAPFEHIKFLVENNFAPTDRTVQVFTALTSGEMDLQSEIQKAVSLLEANAAAPKTSLQAAQTADMWQGLLGQLRQFAAVGTDPNATLESLKTTAQEISTAAKNGGNTALAQVADNIADIIDFSRNITENKTYFQLPFHGENQQLAELHIFKKKGGGGKRGDGRIATALIALDMAFLGRVEILVNKNDKNVSLQFRSDKDKTINTVTLNSLDLSDLLKNAGYVLTGLKAKKLTEKFDVTKDEQAAVGTTAVRQVLEADMDGAPKRYSFDMRV